MLNLFRSLLRFSTAASVYGAERAGGMLTRAGSQRRERRSTSDSLDALTWTTQEQLSESFRLVFQLSDDLQAEWLDPRVSAPAPSISARGLLAMVQRTVSIAGAASAATFDSTQWRELANKVEVYKLVRNAHRLAAPDTEGRCDLRNAVGRAYECGPHEALWLVEGVAHERTRLALERTEAPRGLLTGAEEMPRSSLLMLHAGMGMAFADHVLRGITPRSSGPQVRQAIGRIAKLCRANSDDEHLGAALESLGLISRCFYPGLVARLTDELPRVDETLVDYFWHGVGRAIYFLPIQLIPGFGTIDHALGISAREAPDDRSREASHAGLAWAFALVNLRHPEVMERFLSRHGDWIVGSSFCNAVIDSILSRHQTTPEAEFIADFLRHRPADPQVAKLWQELIERPCDAKIGATNQSDHACSRAEVESLEILAGQPDVTLVMQEKTT